MGKFKKKKKVIAGLALSTVLLGSVSAYAAKDGAFGSTLVGRQPNGSVMTASNHLLTPAGKTVEFPGNPMSVAVNPNGKTAVALDGGGKGGKGLNIMDLTTGKLIGTNVDIGLPNAWGLAYSPDGKTLYATGLNNQWKAVIATMSVADDGTPTVTSTLSLPSASVGGDINPLDMAFGPDGKKLLVALNRDNSLGVVDLQSGKLTTQIPVGNAPASVMVNGNTAYVTNQGGRKANSGDFTMNSSGTQVVSHPELGTTTTGTVSVVDLTTNTVTKTIPVGVQPQRMTLSGKYLFVTNTNSDTVSVIDTQTNDVVQTINIKPYPNAPLGSEPNAVKMINGNQLVVSLGQDNALAVYDWNGPNKEPRLKGLVPTGSFPVDMAIDPINNQLIVSNMNGVGALGPDGTVNLGGDKRTGHQDYQQVGSVTMIPFSSNKNLEKQTDQDLAKWTDQDLENRQDKDFEIWTDQDLVKWTDQVYSDNNWFGLKDQNAEPRNNKKPVAMPERIGEPSTIKHVFYIIRENRTYDQVLGDLGKGNGDSTLTQFGQTVTPNAHQLANTFPLLDNLYTPGVHSAEGHPWVIQATDTDYEEKTAAGGDNRSYWDDPMTNAPTGNIWTNALAHHVTTENFGETARYFSGPEPFGNWTSWYNDYLILSGQKQGSLHVPVGDYQSRTDYFPVMDSIMYKPYPNNSLSIPDVYRAQLFVDRFNEHVKNNDLPQFITMYLPDDHTAGTSKTVPTPQAMVADNDQAVGKIVDAISHSPYWKDSAIFITEDDTQNGVDHVDGHREPAFVISPWVKRGITDSHYWTTNNMIRSMEQILGLKPMNQNDAAADPMSEIFTDKPDFTPYNLVANQIPLNWMNGQPAPQAATTSAAATPAALAPTPAAQQMQNDWDSWSEQHKDDFGQNSKIDTNTNEMNHAVWYATKGYNKPYPGEDKVLTPDEVEKQPESHK
ncbi:40-residue YVTN family beta-propeller repeat-containing protein [Neobacillus massiliamazoniensis]|uniref:40-residue YVTN family beta-propeller repeat-containing protein n=1 Tax=Neobacillus massiliamazoniensis TaxID=1499688 RepID=A0A0U1NU13_9BACI|nr:bifunctional YncE family protein/alkaline phosphatase family protein [Neobacillus massiliamazoniensis]CRK81228.1 40-residue YVTN family beta-propeller repeat-containing protein [Neobacillus massiliamazoniensis]